jgi:alcohol dehydrogenase YqhD (iron-dependent ADH family)
MEDFVFNPKTKIIFGKSKEVDVGDVLSSYGSKKVLFIYGSQSIYNNGLYKRIIASLQRANIQFVEYGNIRPNPTRSQAMCGVYLAKENHCDFILAVGGGSVIDCGKSISVGYYYDGDTFDFNTYVSTPKKALPIGVILTIAASGSECSTSCVISNDVTGIKQGFNSELVRPVFVIENPELTFSVSPYQTACGIVDIISHSLERYFTKSDSELLCDDFALSLIKNVIINGKRVMHNPNDYYARGNLMIASSLSHNDLTNIGKKKNMPIHKIEHAISAMYPNIAHGAGLAVLIPAWMKAVYSYDIDKFAKFAKVVFDVHFASPRESAIIGIQKLEDFFKELQLSSNLHELGVKSKEDISNLSKLVTENGTRVVGHSVKPLTKEELEALLLSCF